VSLGSDTHYAASNSAWCWDFSDTASAEAPCFSTENPFDGFFRRTPTSAESDDGEWTISSAQRSRRGSAYA
jgi:hypothetical protein